MEQVLITGNRMKILRLTALSVAMLALAGCGSMSMENKRVDYKSNAVKAQTLEVPPDLTVPSAEDHFTIPQDDGVEVAKYSDYAKQDMTPRVSAVLPESRVVHLEHDGATYWLVVNDKAENIWPAVKTFWQENGFVIKTEDPQAGIIETDWAENRANISKSGLRSVLGKVFDGMYDSGTRDMYRIRMERSKDGSSTEIHLTQYGKEEVVSSDSSTTKWESRPEDHDLEATMLQMLMAKLGGAETQAKTPAAGNSPAQGLAVAPKLQTLSDGSKGILLSDPFDRSWRIVGLALERAGFVVEDKDRSNGVYFLRAQGEAKEKGWLDKLAFWRSDEQAKPERYQVTVHEGDAGCEVAANDGNGASNDDTQRVIDALYKALGR